MPKKTFKFRSGLEEAVADEHLKNYQEIVEGVDITQDELDDYVNSRS